MAMKLSGELDEGGNGKLAFRKTLTQNRNPKTADLEMVVN